MFISVIVPVYNVEEYLDKCLESLLNQHYSDMEIVVVDDKSTDGSLIIAKKYEKYTNVKVIAKEKKKQHFYIFCTHFHIGIFAERKYNELNQSGKEKHWLWSVKM